MNHDDGISSSMAATGQSFYAQRHNLSGTSIDSEALLDHRCSVFDTVTPRSAPTNLFSAEINPTSCALDDLLQ